MQVNILKFDYSLLHLYHQYHLLKNYCILLKNWSIASPENVNGSEWKYFSAVCWLYGRQIHQALGGRPIGLITTAYAGTYIEFWMPPEALQDCNRTTYVLNIIQFLFYFFSFTLYRSGDVAIQSYDEPSVMMQLNHSNLFNAMIYPFTRMVIYGAIWYQGRQQNSVI